MAALRIAVAVVCVAACGRYNFDPLSGDGGSGDSVRPDASYTARRWVQRPNASQPGLLFAPRLAYHPGLASVVLYGGTDDTDTYTAAMWRLTATGWISICDPCLPGRVQWAALGYDPIRNVLLLYGGDDRTTYSDDLYEFDGTTWRQSPVTSAPARRRRASWIYDANRSRMLLVGGQTSGANSTDDVWTFDGAQWTELVTTGPAPGDVASDATGVTYDPDRGVMALVDKGSGSTGVDDVWAWNGTWSQVCSSCTGRARVGASLIYDPVLAATYVVNGWDETAGDEIAGTWRITGGTPAMVSADPPRRDSSSIAYDAARDVFVLYGGNGNSCPGGDNCNETWELVPEPR